MKYPSGDAHVTYIGLGHYTRPNGFGGYLWWHDCPAVDHVSWGWFGQGDITQSGHVIASTSPLTVTGSLICTDCGDHGFITEGRWVPV